MKWRLFIPVLGVGPSSGGRGVFHLGEDFHPVLGFSRQSALDGVCSYSGRRPKGLCMVTNLSTPSGVPCCVVRGTQVFLGWFLERFWCVSY